MADHSQRLAIVVTAQDLASGKLSKVRTELAGMGTAGKIASVGLGTGMLAVTKGEQALGNFKNRLTSLAAPLAMIGLSGGLFSVAGALEQGISRAEQDATALETLKAVSNDTTAQLSGLLAVTNKYNISADSLTSIVAKTEKNVGKLEMTTGKATKAGKSAALQSLETQKLHIQETGAKTTLINKLISEQKARDALTAAQTGGIAPANKLVQLGQQYGVTLTDQKGKALGFTDLLLNVADAYSKGTDKAKEAALAAGVFTKGYLPLVPILELGRKGILAAQQQAADFGLTLSEKNVQDLAKFKDASNTAHQAVSGLELQLGLLVMPDLTAGLLTFTTFLSAHKPEVQQFFADGLHVAEALGGFITGTLVPAISSVAGAATGIWNSIPGPMKDLLVKGVVADRTMKFFFGMSPIHAVVSLAEGAIQKGLGGILGGLFQRGSSPVNPMFVSGGLGGGLGGPAAAVEGEAMGLAAGGIMATAITAALAVGLAYFADDIQKFLGTDYAHNQNLPLNQLSWPWGPKNTPKIDLGPWKNILGGDSSLPPAAVGPSSSGGTGGNVGSDLYPTQTGGLKAVNQLSGGMSGLLAGGTIGAAGVGMANSIAGIFAQSTSPSLHSMTSAMQQMKDMQARYLSQGDTKLAASIGVDLRAVQAKLTAAINATTLAIQLKQFIATGLLGDASMPGHTPKAPPAVPVTIRDLNIADNARKAYGPDRKI